jgi:hypothetical protein
MSELATLQRWLHDALVFPRMVAPGAVEAVLAPSPQLSAAAGLAIYQSGYILRIARCMRAQFPALCHALGEALFDDFVADYVRELPPESHTLYDLGRRFPGFLEASRPDRDLPEAARETWIDFMVDLAGFERAVFALFDAPGHEGRPFAGTATPDSDLRLQPAFALHEARYPVAAYYHAVRRGEDPPLPPAAPGFAALVRTDFVTRTVPLGEGQYAFLKAMAEGGGVEDGIHAAARRLARPPDEVRQGWRESHRLRWLDSGFFIAQD